MQRQALPRLLPSYSLMVEPGAVAIEETFQDGMSRKIQAKEILNRLVSALGSELSLFYL